MEERKAFSQNLGHSSILTTATCYGEVSEERRCELIRNLSKKPADDAKVAQALALIDLVEFPPHLRRPIVVATPRAPARMDRSGQLTRRGLFLPKSPAIKASIGLGSLGAACLIVSAAPSTKFARPGWR